MAGFTFPTSEIVPRQSKAVVLMKLDHVIEAMAEAKTALVGNQIEQRFKATQEVDKGLDEIDALLTSFASPSLYSAFEGAMLKVAANNIRVNVSQCENSAEEARAALQGVKAIWTTLHPACKAQQAFQRLPGAEGKSPCCATGTPSFGLRN